MSLPVSAQRFLAAQAERVRQIPKRKRIVFPEGNDPRVMAAAERLRAEGLVEPILVTEGCRPVAKYAAYLHERRRSKGMNHAEANALAAKPLYMASLMVALGEPMALWAGLRTRRPTRCGRRCIASARSRR